MDYNPKTGYNYYRLKIIDLDESYEYSMIKAVYLQGEKPSIFPNPVADIIYMSNNTGEMLGYQYSIINLSGVEVQKGNIPNNGQIILNEKIGNGLFMLNMMNNGVSVQKEKILILRN